MLTSTQLANYARVLFWGLETARTEPYEPGDIILIRTDLEAMPLAEAVHELCMRRGFNPVIRVNPNPTIELNFFTLGADEQIEFRTPGDEELFSSLNGLISLIAPSSLTHLKDVDPAKNAKLTVAKKYLREIIDQREMQGSFGWTLCVMPTAALAEQAGLSMEEYTKQIVKAAHLDAEDPVARWQQTFEEALEVKEWINGLDAVSYRVRSENTDLVVGPGKMRRWIGVSGHNIPSFELFLSPDWRETQGVYYADQPSFRSGNLIRGVRLTFEKGEVVEVEAEEGEAFVRKQLAMDEGAKRLGEFSLTDRRFSRIDTFMANTLFDENFGGEFGNCHVAVGSSYADTYAGDQLELTKEKKKELGFNDSALHWDLVNTEPKTVTARLRDGSEIVIYENGEFRKS
jgi:aminopeptidase